MGKVPASYFVLYNFEMSGTAVVKSSFSVLNVAIMQYTVYWSRTKSSMHTISFSCMKKEISMEEYDILMREIIFPCMRENEKCVPKTSWYDLFVPGSHRKLGCALSSMNILWTTSSYYCMEIFTCMNIVFLQKK